MLAIAQQRSGQAAEAKASLAESSAIASRQPELGRQYTEPPREARRLLAGGS